MVSRYLPVLPALGLCSCVFAQTDWPMKPLRLVIPVAPGGGTDYLGRMLAQKMGENIGQPVVVDNRSGAGGSIGSITVARAAPDGYTLLLGYTASHGINPALSKLPYDPATDFSQVSLIASAPNVLVVHPSIPAKTVQELVAYGKSRKEPMRYASAGIGSAPHMSGEMFNSMSGTRFVHVPYKGNGPALNDVLGGHVDLIFAALPAAIQHGKTGRLRMLAVTGLRRAPQVPDLPTVHESGLKGFNTDQWYGVLLPAKAAPALVARLHKEVLAVVKSQDFSEKAQGQGFDVIGSTPEQFRAHIVSEVAKWKRLVAEVGIKAE
jgi:tripartite-type tricarboxylate transporter receptor subunit TctC